MSYHISKSRYCAGLQCPKMLWLKKYKPEAFDQASKNEAALETGLEVGDLAMGLFGDFVEVPYTDPGQMLLDTQKLMEQNVPVIAEASFSVNGCFCSVDILRRVNDRDVEIYEVKSSTSVSEIYRHDAAFQYYILEQLGYRVLSCNIVHINKHYVRHGELDLHQLFTVADITQSVLALQPSVRENIRYLQNYMEQETEPADDIGMHCFAPYDCGFFSYCTRHLPTPNVFDVGGLHKDKAIECYRNGITSFQDLDTYGKLSANQYMQIEHEVHPCPPRIDRKNIRSFLEKITYPLYFFDFESYMPAVPPYDNMGPFDQIVFQYSLHYIAEEGGPLLHKEFLAYPGADPRRALAEQMCRDIPRDACIMTYNMSFEKGRTRELAKLFPDLADHLMNIHDHIIDLIVPFRSKWYYCRGMQGSYSIKYVLPALFPDDPELDYHNLEGIHHGGEACAAFEAMAKMTPEEMETTRQQLLAYCGLDTFAMYKIWQKLKEVCA